MRDILWLYTVQPQTHSAGDSLCHTHALAKAIRPWPRRARPWPGQPLYRIRTQRCTRCPTHCISRQDAALASRRGRDPRATLETADEPHTKQRTLACQKSLAWHRSIGYGQRWPDIAPACSTGEGLPVRKTLNTTHCVQHTVQAGKMQPWHQRE